MESAANLRSPTTFSAEFSNRTLEQDLPIFSPQFRVPCRKKQTQRCMIKASWLVVSTPLKNISRWEGLSHILWKNMFQTTNQPQSCIYKLKASVYPWKFRKTWLYLKQVHNTLYIAWEQILHRISSAESARTAAPCASQHLHLTTISRRRVISIEHHHHHHHHDDHCCFSHYYILRTCNL